MKIVRSFNDIPNGEHFVILKGHNDQSVGLNINYYICDNEQEFKEQLKDDKVVGIKVVGKAKVQLTYTFDIPK